jgi:hypothetical protein
MTRIAKRSGARRLRQTSKRERFVQPKSVQRRSANTLRRESAFLVRQQPQESREATRRVSPPEGRAKDGVDETTSRDPVTSNRPHERQRRVDASYSMHHIRQSLGQFMCKGGKKVVVDQGVDQARQTCKRSLSANLEGLREVEAEVLRAEAHTVLKLVPHDEAIPMCPSQLAYSAVHSI